MSEQLSVSVIVPFYNAQIHIQKCINVLLKQDFTKPFEELTKGRFIIGSPEDVISDLKKFDEIGVTHASLRFGWPGTPKQIVKDAISLAASEVLPHFRDSTK